MTTKARADFLKMRQMREDLARASKKRREKNERERLQKPHKDLGSPFGFGPVYEDLSPQRHLRTPEPWDASDSDSSGPKWGKDTWGGGWGKP